jgi:hypothetical protein
VLEIDAGGTAVQIAFHDDSDGAAGRASLLERSAASFGRKDASDAIETKGNVTYWTTGDRPDEAFDDVDACLSD